LRVGKLRTASYHTLGCKVNQYETEVIRVNLEEAGFETVDFGSAADVVVINTCGVTSEADSKSRAAIRRATRISPDAYVIVCGCFAELEPGQIRQIDGVDLVVSNTEKESIPKTVIARFGGTPHPDPLPREREMRTPRSRTRAVVKVQDGCDQFCSYCIVPFARPVKVSRSVEDVLTELRSLAGFGYREIVLTGIRLGSYDSGGARLPQLIRASASVDGIERIRLSSVEPWEVGAAVLEAMRHPKVCRHLHIPLQSGDDTVLAAMNRPYDSSEYLAMIAGVRESIPDIGITTDVIVGYPGESDDAFENTCRVIEAADFARLHVFRYSPRKRTKAAEMPGQIDASVKKERSERLIDVGRDAVARFAEGLTGKEVSVLVEKHSELRKIGTGLADNYVEVAIACESSRKGQIVRAAITGVSRDGTAIGLLRD